MIKNRLLRLIVIFFGCILSVAVLFQLSIRNNAAKGSFIRLVPPHVVSNFKYIDIGYNSFYIAAIENDSIYLGNTSSPTTLLVADLSLSSAQYRRIPAPQGFSLVVANTRCMFAYPSVFLVDGQTGSVLHHELPLLGFQGNYHIPVPHIEEIKPISASSSVIKYYNTQKHQSDLFKYNNEKSLPSPTSPILERQVDGHFCTDGVLLFSPVIHRMVYVYYYRNQYIVLDSNLTVISRNRTIDTNTIAKIALDTVAVNKMERSVIFKSPPLIVNTSSCVYGNKLFIQSASAASNEDISLLRDVVPIDVYDLDKGLYQFSFYIPKFKGYSVKHFQVNRQGIVVIYDKWLATYSLSQDVFK